MRPMNLDSWKLVTITFYMMINTKMVASLPGSLKFYVLHTKPDIALHDLHLVAAVI